MTRYELLPLNMMLETAIAHYGPRRVLLAALGGFFAPAKRAPQDASQLGDHLRRDVGLPPAEPSSHYLGHLR
ncbi:hypothetical protein AIOL_002938 [Candidatus Rhodobacter oscarellae]|uniref:Uncharacterized protein n=1 Tax=Candidatus Rhodobacter oscarellae TaxID=1675527 RepID=A0A0J9E5B9_9RHOB|nr:hypothetical protein [Candidatus Rhodobacter lobularis]KMW57970.1 hypothetical protein AIOL_002938 [Candidatus Rhodobacter lobularis]